MVSDGTPMHLRDYVGVLQRRKLLIALAVLLVVGSALGVSLVQAPVYEARARLLLEANTSVFTQAAVQGSRVQTEIQVIESAPVAAAVREKLGVAPPSVSAVQVGATDVVEVRVLSDKGLAAADTANAYAEVYIQYRRQQAIDTLLAAAAEVQRKIDSVNKDIADLDARTPAAAANQSRPDRDALVTQRVLFKQKLDELQVDASLKSGGASVVAPAVAPTTPIRPRPIYNAVLGGTIGLVIGCALAFLFEHLDDSVKTKEDLERAVPNVAVLALIPPAAEGWRNKAEAKVISRTDPRSPAAEAYRGLRTSIRFLGLDRSIRTLQVTSALASEGKSTTIANLAVALARAGQRVAVVCCDLRRPRIHEFFGLSNKVGLTTVLLGEAPLAKALQAVPGENKLYLLASGAPPPNPSELLSSPRCDELLRALSGQFDIVLIDCPPVLPVTDAVVLSARVDGTLLIANGGSSTGKQVGRAAEVLRQVGAPLIGTVLNNAFAESGYGDTYGYGTYLPSEPSNSPKNGRKPAGEQPDRTTQEPRSEAQ